MAQQPDLVSIRNLVDADVGPLRRFKGVLDSFPTKMEKFQGSDRETMRVTLNFREIEVIEAVEPYAFPVFSTQPMSVSNRKKSAWGVFGQSLAGVLDMQFSKEQLDPKSPQYVKPENRPNLRDCIGKRVGMVMADGEAGRPPQVPLFDGRTKAEVPRSVWMVYEVEGIGAVRAATGETPIQKAMKLLDGKNLQDFTKDAMADASIRADMQLLTSISLPVSAPNSFVSVMLTTDQFSKDADGVFHKK